METATLDAPPREAAHRGRPREFCTQQALAAALRVFWQRGYEGASLTELTEAMGITRPSLYAAYGNKEALFRKALDLYFVEKLAYMERALDAPTARGVAERLFAGALSMQCESNDPRGCLSMIAAAGCAPQGEAVKAAICTRRGEIDDAVLGRFERARAEGDLPADIDPAGLARLLGAILQGMNALAAGGADAGQLRAVVDTALAIWPGR